MLKQLSIFLLFSLIFSALSCKEKNSQPLFEKVSIDGISPMNGDSTINVLIEIPAGTTAKFEFDKNDKTLKIDSLNGKPRYIDYLGYPGNYGMIPNTLLDKSKGGDGDPLDILLLGRSLNRGQIVPAYLIGVLKLEDGGEQDDKLIAVPTSGWNANDLKSLDENYPGAMRIVQTFFAHYKGKGKMKFIGWGDRQEAYEILNTARIE